MFRPRGIHGRVDAALLPLLGIGRRPALADDILYLGTAQLDRPTVVTLGVQLLISGDDNFNAQVAVRYRIVGSVPWRDGLALFRVHPETVGGRTVPTQFAGSVFDLAPATAYEIELDATDADGGVDQTVVVTGTTRTVPTDPATATVRPVSDAAGLRTALANAQPGDVITLAPGTYAGTFELDASGTAANPIVIRGASDDSVVLDGARMFANVNDTFTGAAPDLGALAAGCPLPIYGPRPVGIDESNAPIGCGGPPNTGETTVPIQTTSLKLSDRSAPPANPAACKLSFKSKTTGDPIAARVLVPAVGGAGDPTIHGASVTLYNAAGDSQKTIIALPAAGWSILGTPLAPRGYRYRAAVPGAISKVSLQRDRLTLSGGGASFGYGLAAPSQGRVALRLQFGTQLPWCAAAPAKRIGTPAITTASDKPDLFVAQTKTPGPILCPPVP